MQQTIKIGGRSFRLKSDDDDGVDLQEVASMVDSRMKELSSKAPRADDFTIAVLTALNIASETARDRLKMKSELLQLDKTLAAAEAKLKTALTAGD